MYPADAPTYDVPLSDEQWSAAVLNDPLLQLSMAKAREALGPEVDERDLLRPTCLELLDLWAAAKRLRQLPLGAPPAEPTPLTRSDA